MGIKTQDLPLEPSGTGIMAQVRAQAEQAVAEADAILFLADGKEGLTPADSEVARLLRQGATRPILLAVNKVDATSQTALAADFYRLGFDPVYPISAEQGQGIGDLLDAVASAIPDTGESADEAGAITVAVVGRPNVGKSSLVNRILGTERVVVSAEPGTTRDAIDTRFSYQGRDYILVDTAGIRAKGLVKEADIDKLIKMCLFHDLPEARTGDLNYVNKKYVKTDEKKAVNDLADTLPFGDEIRDLIFEFLKGESLEARLAYDADQLEMIVALKEYKDLGNTYADEWLDFALKRLKTDIARGLAETILETDSSLWWFSDKGDWWVKGKRE